MKELPGIYWICLTLSLVFIAAGAVELHAILVLAGAALLGVFAAGAEVTRRKEAVAHEEERSRIHEELAQTQTELENAREVVSDLRAEELKLFRELSHAMRVPISIVVGYADLLIGGYVSEQETAVEYMGKIRDNVGYINDLLSQMLMEVRNNGGMPSLIVERLDVLSMVREIARDMSNVFATRGVAVQVSSSEEHIWLEGDGIRIQKAFHNILENSLKYMDREGLVNITCSYAGDDEVMIVVKDDGKGLPPQETEHIFELNYQGSNKKSGYGLGLHLVRETVRSHGGRISAKSDEGKGMGIYIYLPTTYRPMENPPEEPFEIEGNS